MGEYAGEGDDEAGQADLRGCSPTSLEPTAALADWHVHQHQAGL